MDVHPAAGVVIHRAWTAVQINYDAVSRAGAWGLPRCSAATVAAAGLPGPVGCPVRIWRERDKLGEAALARRWLGLVQAPDVVALAA